MLSALRRHNVFKKVRGIVVGSFTSNGRNPYYKKQQREALRFIVTYLRDVIRKRRRQGFPLPIFAVANFGHNIKRDLMAVPIGGHVSISRSKKITFRMSRTRP